MTAMVGFGRAFALALVSILAACSGAHPTAIPTAVPGTGGPTPSATASAPSTTPGSTATATPTPAPSVAGPSYTNPVFALDFPDPHVLRAGDTYYGYSTNNGSTNLPIIKSTDLVNWQRQADGMPALPVWAKPNFGNVWAPGVIQIGETTVLYFVARDKVSDRQCIGVAVADSPVGPFSHQSAEPFICQADLGGSIDPYPFLDDDGQLYIYWKNDGNCCAKPVELWVQPLSEDGLALTGEPVALIARDQVWEIPLIENPAMTKNDDSYYLFYSANWWESADYAVGYAICETAVGPCTKPQNGPVFESAGSVAGPGGEAFVTDAQGNLWMTYHAWTLGRVGYPVGMRSLRIDRASFNADGLPVITGPTSDAQPLP